MDEEDAAEFVAKNIRDLEEKVAYNIEHFGVHLTGVFPTQEKPDEIVSFCYTAGMHEKGYPELIVAGLPYQTAGTLLNDLAAKIMNEEVPFHPGRIPGLIKDYDAWLIKIYDLSDFTIAKNRADDVDVAVATPLQGRQLCWPDDTGLFPWQIGYNHERFPQPLRDMEPLAAEGWT